MKSPWPTKKLGDTDYFEILESGIDKFKGEKYYLSTSSIDRNRVVKIEDKITYYKRPSRANMQPRLNSVWFARMQNTVKVYSFTEENKDEVDKYILSTGFAGILCKSNEVYPKYLEKIFLSDWFNYLKDSLAGDKAIQRSLNNEDIKFLDIPLPPLSIQQKIVKILDIIQNAVEVQDKIIELTKELKKSVMADLFKYGAPSFRKGRKLKKTEIGEIPEDWKVVRLGSIAKLERGKFAHRPRNDPKFYGGHIPFIQTNDVVSSNGKIERYSQTLNQEGLSISKLFPKGTIVITIAASIGYVGILEFDSAFPDSIVGITPNSKVARNFLLYYLMTQQSVMNALAPRGTQKNINIQFLAPWPIPLPPLPEQQEIAEILQTIDKKIELERRKKELYEELFRTMLNKIMRQEIDVEKIEI